MKDFRKYHQIGNSEKFLKEAVETMPDFDERGKLPASTIPVIPNLIIVRFFVLLI